MFLTGHTGFKGSWLSLWLHQLGARVTGYALEPPTEPNNFVVSRVPDVLSQHHLSDVRDLEGLTAAMEQAQPEVIFHLAAQSVVRYGYRAPEETFATNVMGTVNVLEAVRGLKLPCTVVCVTSDKCYENREQVWGYRETDALGDHDPYGGSKGAAELAIRAYRDSFFPPRRVEEHGVRLASARAGNVIGGGDWTADALLVDVVRALDQGQTIPLRSPQAFRPWQHVLQALSGYLTLAGRLLDRFEPEICSGWNFGPFPGSEIPVQEVVDLFLAEWGDGHWQDVSDPRAPREATILRLAIDKAIWQLDWAPRWSVRRALQETATWYQRYLDGSTEMQALCHRQIAAYENSAPLREQLTGRSSTG